MKHILLKSEKGELNIKWRILGKFLGYVIEFTKEETEDLKNYLNKE